MLWMSLKKSFSCVYTFKHILESFVLYGCLKDVPKKSYINMKFLFVRLSHDLLNTLNIYVFKEAEILEIFKT